MKLNAFVCLILIMTAFWMQVFSASQKVFSGMSEAKEEITRLKTASDKERVQVALEREQFLEFRQDIASLMPDVLKQKGLGNSGYVFRNLASTITKAEGEQVRATIAKTLFETAKKHFNAKEYVKAERSFHEVIDRYGYTTYVPESYFLMAESQFQDNQSEEAVNTIQQMIELFPSHELTGFAMIRLGHIYEAQNRNEEAVDIYRTVMRTYPQRDVASQAKASLRGVDQ